MADTATSTATATDAIAEVKAWLADNWDPDLTIGVRVLGLPRQPDDERANESKAKPAFRQDRLHRKHLLMPSGYVCQPDDAIDTGSAGKRYGRGVESLMEVRHAAARSFSPTTE